MKNLCKIAMMIHSLKELGKPLKVEMDTVGLKIWWTDTKASVYQCTETLEQDLLYHLTEQTEVKKAEIRQLNSTMGLVERWKKEQ